MCKQDHTASLCTTRYYGSSLRARPNNPEELGRTQLTLWALGPGKLCQHNLGHNRLGHYAGIIEA